MIGLVITIFLFCGFLCAVVPSIQEHVAAGEKEYRDYAFNVVFSLLFAIWGFIFIGDEIPGKLGAALFFSAGGWLISFIFSGLTNLIRTKGVKLTAQIVVIGALAFFVFSTNYGTPAQDSASYGSGLNSSSHSCCICGDSASKVYGGDYWCVEHYYMAKTMDGDLSP